MKKPAYSADKPSAEHIAILRTNHHARVTESNLIGFTDPSNPPFTAEYDSDQRQGKYRLLDTHIIDPLQEQAYIESEEIGHGKRVSFIERGVNTLQAFQYLLESPSS